MLVSGGAARTPATVIHEELFRQESYFQHLFGVKEPGWVGTVEVPSGTCTLFAPELPEIPCGLACSRRLCDTRT